MLLIGVKDIQEKARLSLRSRRLALGFTQAGLAKRSGVKLPTLRKFERTGKISFEALLNLALVLDYFEPLSKALEPITEPYKSIDDVLKPKEKLPQRGRIT